MFAQVPQTVRDWFAFRGIDAVVDEGEEAHASQTNFGPGMSNRVVFVPAEGPYQSIAPTHIGDNPRQLKNLLVVLDVYFAGYDAANPKRDLMHLRYAMDLYEAVEQAMQHAYYGAYEMSDPGLNVSKKHLHFGVELTAQLAVNIPIYDVASLAVLPVAPIPGDPKPA